MPRKKKNAETAAVETAAVETAVVETAVVETVPAPAAEETPKKRVRKSAEKKTETASAVEETPKKRGRKSAEKKTETAAAEETPKKRSRKPAEKKAANENVVIQFMGAAVSASELIAKAKADCGVESPKTVDVYVKPEENMVYYVVDGVTGEFTLA